MKMHFVLPIVIAIVTLAVICVVSDSEDTDAAAVDPSGGELIDGIYYYKNGTSTAIVWGISSDNQDTTEITIPETVTIDDVDCTVIGIGLGSSSTTGKFSQLTSLQTVTLPSTMTMIGDYAFYGCTGLSTVNLSEGLTTIRDSAFFGCTSLTHITIPESVTEIMNNAFRNSGLTSIIMAGTPTTISNSSFTNAPVTKILNLGSLELSDGSYGLPDSYSVYTSLDNVAMIQQVEYEEHTTEVVDREGSEYTLMNLLPVLVVIGLVMAGLFALIRVRAQD